jgi:hypothetical protein
MKRIETVVEIAAPASVVWRELSAVAAYASWNPFITRFEGEVRAGTQVEVRIEPPGGRPMTFQPTITDVQDGTRLEWLGKLVVPGVFDGRHSFHVEHIAPDRSRLTQVEEFSGALVPFMPKTLEKTRQGFDAMNEALRLRAERAFAGPIAG